MTCPSPLCKGIIYQHPKRCLWILGSNIMPFETHLWCMVGNSAQPPFPLPSSTSSLFWELRVAYPTAPQTKVKPLMQFFHFSWEPGPATAICMSSQYIFHFGDLVICGAFKCFVSVRAKWPPQKLAQAPWAKQQKAATEKNLRIRVRWEVVQENKGVMCDAIWLTVSFCKMGPPNSDGGLPELLTQHSVISSNCVWLQVHLHGSCIYRYGMQLPLLSPLWSNLYPFVICSIQAVHYSTYYSTPSFVLTNPFWDFR